MFFPNIHTYVAILLQFKKINNPIFYVSQSFERLQHQSFGCICEGRVGISVPVSVYMCHCTCVRVHVSVYICPCTCVVYLCQCTCVMYSCQCTCVSVPVSVYMCECTYVNIPVSVYLCHCTCVSVCQFTGVNVPVSVYLCQCTCVRDIYNLNSYLYTNTNWFWCESSGYPQRQLAAM